MTKTENDMPGFPEEMLQDLLTTGLSSMTPIPTGMLPRGALRNAPLCILFDIYGTLLISGTGDISIARKSVNASEKLQVLLDSFGIETAPEKLLAAFFEEIRNAHQAARAEGTDWPEVQIERIWSKVLGMGDIPRVQRFAIEFEIMANPVWPMPGLAELLAACRKAGLPMGIISNAQFYTPRILQWFLKSNLADLGFKKDLLIYSYKTGCAKPSPKLFHLAADRLMKRGISPEAVLYVGNDLRKDILPAKQAGFQTALFAGDARSLRPDAEDPAHREVSADLVVTELSQLLPIINDRGVYWTC